eukprot:TRINITY_DN18512_c0_g1_i1.p1 TRINITY_DN18512_c0_g1~~TRINITY_DN18512_c0_g1_i1.p1  ORF type:complete len:1265 (-),score=273.79 TRINITY_DN18512_c0_g1_i1:45-3839(-)
MARLNGVLLAWLQAVLAFREQGEVQRHEGGLSTEGGVERCQYSALPAQHIPTGRPLKESLVAICPDNELSGKCKISSASKDAVVAERYGKITVADCENFCNQNKFMQQYGNLCLGYVLRNPWNKDLQKGKPQCYLIKGTAKRAYHFPDEVKMSRSSVAIPATKLTYFKDYCSCEARVIAFQRPEWKTALAVKTHQLSELRKEKPNSIETLGVQSHVLLLREKAEKLRALEAYQGLYEWIPLRPPHRIVKGVEKLLPNSLVSILTRKMVSGQKGSFSNYFNSPVRITKIYKKSDNTAALYRCLDKASNHEAWYVVDQREPLEWVSSNFKAAEDHNDEEVKQLLAEDANIVKRIFFQLQCLGDKIENGKISHKLPSGEIVEATLHANFLEKDDEARQMTMTPQGCFKTGMKAQAALEEKLIEDVGRCPVAHLTQQPEDGKVGLMTLTNSNATFLESLLAAEKLVGKVADNKWISTGLAWGSRMISKGMSAYASMRQSTPDADDSAINGAKLLSEFTTEELRSMLGRTSELLQGLTKLWTTMEAAANTDDNEVKLTCAKEMLDHVFAVGGLLPKVSQNLAMRPDLVQDDLVRTKLKETQNANPSRSGAETEEYIASQEPTVSLTANRSMKLLDLLEYKKALSAGSVGQVDLFEVRKDLDPSVKQEFMKLLPKGHDTTVILKTVFEDTEQAYFNDWNLLEQFFVKLKDKIDPSIAVIWKFLAPMKESIFDEFDLRKEAGFTMRGKDILAEFTRNIDEGAYAPTLAKGDIKLTTPNAIATSSPYILIQSIAPGLPLKNHLENSAGQVEVIAEWREKIYAAILMVYGHMVMKHGFFQSDPHNGNWFWDESSNTVTLIDWGGVGQLDPSTHCKLSKLYSRMGKLVNSWSRCESVTVEGKNARNGEINGIYKRNGLSIFDAGENDSALIFGKTYTVSYMNEETGYRLWYDGSDWVISEEKPGAQEFNVVKAKMASPLSNMQALAGEPQPMPWTVFSGSSAKSKGTAEKLQLKLPPKDSCNLPSRPHTYASAAAKLGLVRMDLSCEPENLVLMPEAPLTQNANDAWKDNGKRQLGCIIQEEDGQFINWGIHQAAKLQVMTKPDGQRFVDIKGTEFYIDDTKDVAPQEVPEWVYASFSEDVLNKVRQIPEPKRSMLLRATSSQLAVATAMFDSDLMEAAILGLDARDSVGIVVPDPPTELSLLARCVIVFHGMLGDVVKENFLRFMVSGQEAFIQWLLRSSGDKFFRSWSTPAVEYMAKNKDTCDSTEDWLGSV